jgi:NitT/TauT family transport system substrate-binding protein
VDAIFDYEPLALRAVLETPGRYLFEPAKAWAEREEGWSPYLTNLAARVDWLEENEELALEAKDAWLEAVERIEETDYEIFAEEPYRGFLQLASQEELDAFIDYCAELPCFVTSWTDEDIEKLDGWLALMAESNVLIEETATEPVAVQLEDFYGNGGS